MLVLGVFIISVLVLVLFSVGLLIKGVLYLFNRFRGRQVLFATKGVRRSLLGMLVKSIILCKILYNVSIVSYLLKFIYFLVELIHSSCRSIRTAPINRLAEA